MDDKQGKSLGLKNNNSKLPRKIFDSPSSKARILTPVKNALHKSQGNAYKFCKALQNIVDNKENEDVNAENFDKAWEL
ncbi:hypothetical protein AAJ76_2300034899 [Vairimorpha ceranae]|uniref:Uncharacterized protein n=1 Tax=Vairimorpha ceranae TaxID=40302 RepID=A0A0F9ZCS1_9MICR|nr:hypothetical protein AAJ76_2300034899 [Vairimorpha ceranae]KAF5140011.1 hypothetical protein G9O61_00g017360 [Vairimorpha ceranae]KKO75374.1 hypothetical protein AAJ76_2300034899 [Vairimorpha ceranae]